MLSTHHPIASYPREGRPDEIRVWMSRDLWNGPNLGWTWHFSPATVKYSICRMKRTFSWESWSCRGPFRQFAWSANNYWNNTIINSSSLSSVSVLGSRCWAGYFWVISLSERAANFLEGPAARRLTINCRYLLSRYLSLRPEKSEWIRVWFIFFSRSLIGFFLCFPAMPTEKQAFFQDSVETRVEWQTLRHIQSRDNRPRHW